MKSLAAIVFLLLALSFRLFSQPDTIKKDPGQFFADIHTFGQCDLTGRTTPQQSFGINTAILGYKRKLSDKVQGSLLYDVTRTTNFTYPDSIGISSYFEGSKYTAFLKMAEIDWKPLPKLGTSFGMLLNEQYLTIQDKHWGLRYVSTTMQELFRFGNPADFGIRIKFYPTKKLYISLSAVNGDGPFRHQDIDSKMQYSVNIEYRPNDIVIMKFYTDVQQAPIGYSNPRIVFNGFAGLKNDVWTSGIEYSRVTNNGFDASQHLDALSGYLIRKLGKKLTLFARADYMLSYGSTENEIMVMTGMEFRPVSQLGISADIRRNSWLNTTIIGLRAGMRF